MQMSVSGGNCWRFPVMAEPKTGEIARVGIEDDIKQSIMLLLSTRPGERIGRPDYGCGLQRFTFESLTYGLLKEACTEITDTLRRWEDRIQNVCVEAVPGDEEGVLVFGISYCIAETGRREEVRYELNTR